jgi:hypothetical protein
LDRILRQAVGFVSFWNHDNRLVSHRYIFHNAYRGRFAVWYKVIVLVIFGEHKAKVGGEQVARKSFDMTPQERMAATEYILQLAERVMRVSCESKEKSVEIVASRPATRATDEPSH